MLREENAARLSNSERRGLKMLPEEAPIGQCINRLAVECALSDERQSS